jgi:hypothetical protein
MMNDDDDFVTLLFPNDEFYTFIEPSAGGMFRSSSLQNLQSLSARSSSHQNLNSLGTHAHPGGVPPPPTSKQVVGHNNGYVLW